MSSVLILKKNVLINDMTGAILYTIFQYYNYIQYDNMFTYSGVQHMLSCIFVLFYFFLSTLCYQLLWIVNLLLPL